MDNDVTMFDLKALRAYNKSVKNASDISTLQTMFEGISSMSPKGVYDTVDDLETAFPTGNNNVYVVKADGKWYYWDDEWLPGDTYQAVDAKLIEIEDEEELYEADNVEDALQEVKTELDAHKSDYAQQANMKLNNLLPNGDFSSGIADWKVSSGYGTISYEDGKLKYVMTTHTWSNAPYYRQGFTEINIEDIFYIVSDIYSSVERNFFYAATILVSVTNVCFNQKFTLIPKETWTKFSERGKFPSGEFNNNQFKVGMYSDSSLIGEGFYIDNIRVLNLTQIFGAGNEPTKDEMDVLIDQIGYFDGEIVLSQKQILNWQLAMIRANTAAIAGL